MTAAAITTRRLALVAVCLVMFLTFLDMTIVSVALANVQSHLHAGVTQLQWVVNGYGLTFAVFMLLGGTLGDRLGRKKVMLGGLIVLSLIHISPSMTFFRPSRSPRVPPSSMKTANVSP